MAPRNATGLSVIAGDVSKCFVIDVDPRNGGRETWENLTQEFGRFDEGLTVKTPGGFHIYMSLPSGFHVSKRVHGLGPGVDVLGNGAAPTVFGTRKSGETYRIEWAELTEPPAWILERVPQQGAPAASGQLTVPKDQDMCDAMRDKAQALVYEASHGDRLDTLRKMRYCAAAYGDGHTGLYAALKLGFGLFCTARHAKEAQDGIQRFPEEDYVRMCQAVMQGATQGAEDPCTREQELLDFFLPQK